MFSVAPWTIEKCNFNSLYVLHKLPNWQKSYLDSGTLSFDIYYLHEQCYC